MHQMVHRDPAHRPTAAEAYQQFKAIRRHVSPLTQYWSLQPRGSYLLAKVFWHVYSSVSAQVGVMGCSFDDFVAVLLHLSLDPLNTA